MRIRAVRAGELPVLEEIEGAAGQPFAEIGMTEIAQDEPYPLPVLAVPWNAPYYLRGGFRVLDTTELSRGLLAVRSVEAELGLDRWPRVCMRRDL